MVNPWLWRIISFIALALLGAWLILRTDNPSISVTSNAPESPNFFTQDGLIIQFGLNGKPLYEMKSKTALHYAIQQKTDITNVELTYHRYPEDPWLLTAAQGVVPDDQNLPLTVSGNVHMVLHRPKDDYPATIDTSTLDVWPRQQRAATQAPVQINQNKNKVTAIGLKADLQTGILILEQEVHGHYVP